MSKIVGFYSRNTSRVYKSPLFSPYTLLVPLQVTPAVIFGCQGPRTWVSGRWILNQRATRPPEERGTPQGVLNDYPLFTLPRPPDLRVTGHNTPPSGAVLSALWRRGRTANLCIQAELRDAIEGLRTAFQTPL